MPKSNRTFFFWRCISGHKKNLDRSNMSTSIRLESFKKVVIFIYRYSIMCILQSFKDINTSSFQLFFLLNGIPFLGFFDVFYAILGVFWPFSQKWFFFEKRYRRLKKFFPKPMLILLNNFLSWKSENQLYLWEINPWTLTSIYYNYLH